MYLISAACLAVAQAQSSQAAANPQVSVLLRASVIPKVLNVLSEQTKLKFEFSPVMANEVLVISAQNVQLKDLMDQIASATTSEWRTIEGGYRLVPNNTLRQQELNREISARSKAMQKSIADQIKESDERRKKVAEQINKNSKTKEQALGMFEGESEQALICKILQGLNPAQLANIEAGDRVVFSTQPNQLQIPLPQSATPIINSIVAIHNQSVVGRQELNDELINNEELAKLPDFMKSRMTKNSKKIGEVAKALISFSKNDLMGMYTAELTLYDPKGTVAYETSAMLTGEMSKLLKDVEDAFDEEGNQKPKKPETIKGTVIEYSEDTKELQKQTRMMGMEANVQISKTVIEKACQPAVYDPLSFGTTDELLAVAKLTKKPFVANVPDSMVAMTRFMFNAGKTAESVLKSMENGEDLQILRNDGWLVAKPAKPDFSRKYRVDRVALQNLVQAGRKKGAASLDDLAAFVEKVPSPNEAPLAQTYLMMYVPGSITTSMAGMTDWNLVRFYAGLSPEAKINAQNGVRISLSALTPGQGIAVRRMVYTKKGSLDVSRPGKPAKEKLPFMDFLGSDSIDYLDEPTEAHPTGVPASGYVELKIDKDPIFSPISTPGKEYPPMLGILGPDEVSLFRMMKEDKNMAQFANDLPNFDQVKLGQRLVYNFKFQFTPVLGHGGTLHDNSFPQVSQIMSLNSLPTDVQKLMNDRYAKFKSSPLGAMMGLAGMRQQQQVAPPLP